MWITIISLVAGAATKALASYFSNKSTADSIHKLATTNASHETIKLLQRDYDQIDWTARVTRIFIVLPIAWVFLSMCVYVVMVNPDLSYSIQTERVMSPVWQFFLPFPINKQGLVTINGVFVIERLWIATFYIIGFYLNKFGK